MFIMVQNGSAIVNLDLCSKVATQGREIFAYSPESLNGSRVNTKGSCMFLGDYHSEEQACKVIHELSEAVRDGRKVFSMPEAMPE